MLEDHPYNHYKFVMPKYYQRIMEFSGTREMYEQLRKAKMLSKEYEHMEVVATIGIDSSGCNFTTQLMTPKTHFSYNAILYDYRTDNKTLENLDNFSTHVLDDLLKIEKSDELSVPKSLKDFIAYVNSFTKPVIALTSDALNFLMKNKKIRDKLLGSTSST